VEVLGILCEDNFSLCHCEEERRSNLVAVQDKMYSYEIAMLSLQ